MGSFQHVGFFETQGTDVKTDSARYKLMPSQYYGKESPLNSKAIYTVNKDY